MIRICFTVVLCVCISLVQPQLLEVSCPTSGRPAPIKVSVSGRRNETGHWFTQVGVQHKKLLQDTEEKNRSSDEWKVDVEHSSVICHDLELTTNVILTFSAPLPKTLPGYKLLPGLGFYKVYDAVNTWQSARQICANDGSHLVVITSEREAAAIKTLFPAGSDWQSWVGIYEEGADGKYFTVFGDAASANTTGYMTWFPGEPNDKTVGNCILLSCNPRAGYGYNDYICATKQIFICKQ